VRQAALVQRVVVVRRAELVPGEQEPAELALEQVAEEPDLVVVVVKDRLGS